MPRPSATSGPQTAASLAARMPPLVLAARRLAATLAQGRHNRRRPGPGEGFLQHRPYRTGDSPRQIDWRASARHDHPLIREYERDTARTLLLWRDGSASMDFRSAANLHSKKEQADILLLALTMLALSADERVLWLEGSDQHPVRHFHDLAAIIAASDHKAPLPAPPPPRPGTVMLLAGDFLDPLEQTEHLLSRMHAQGLGGVLLQILDPAEYALPYRGAALFEDPEGPDRLNIDRVQDMTGTYRAHMRARCHALRDLCLKRGWTALLHRTDHALPPVLLALHRALSHDRLNGRRQP